MVERNVLTSARQGNQTETPVPPLLSRMPKERVAVSPVGSQWDE